MKSAEDVTDEMCDYFDWARTSEQARVVEEALIAYADDRGKELTLQSTQDLVKSIRNEALEEAATILVADCEGVSGDEGCQCCACIHALTIRSLKTRPEGV